MEPSDTQQFCNRLNAVASIVAGDALAPSIDLRPDRIAEIMRLQAENAFLRAAYAEIEARYVALHALRAAHPAGLVDAAPGFPTNALRHSA